MARGQFAGAVAAVSMRGNLAAFEAVGWADRATRQPMQKSTLFRIASMTKPITSVALLMLHERLGFSLETPASRFLPELAELRVLAPSAPNGTAPLREPVRLRHLLTHTSGLSYRMRGEEPLSTLYAQAGVTDGLVVAEFDAAENSRRLATAPLRHQPGADFTYGLSTDVLGHLVEVISGEPLPAYLRSQVFIPLGMHDTFFHVPPARQSRLARVYHWSEARGLQPLTGRVDRGHESFSTDACVSEHQRYDSGGAGLVSTAGDYLRFAQMLAGGGSLGEVRLLRQSTVARMTQHQIGSHRLPGGDGFGFGVAVVEQPDDERSPGSFGWQGFYATHFWIDPHRSLTAVFLTQLRANDEVDVLSGFVQAAYADAR